MKFPELVGKVLTEDKIAKIPVTILTLDPGETTGWAIWHRTEWFPDGIVRENPIVGVAYPKLFETGQADTKKLHTALSEPTSIAGLIKSFGPDLVVMEDYRIYEWKAEEHSWSSVHTIQLIGLIKTLCIQQNIPFVLQSAQVAKQFCTDDKLESWGYWQKGMRHARDAIRHGAYYLLFGSQKSYDPDGYVIK